MKARDYVFWIFLTFASLFVGHMLRLPGDSPQFAPAAPSIAPRATLWDKATYWAAVWRIGSHFAPRKPPPADRQELPDGVVNAPAVRAEGPDGQPLLDHSAGW